MASLSSQSPSHAGRSLGRTPGGRVAPGCRIGRTLGGQWTTPPGSKCFLDRSVQKTTHPARSGGVAGATYATHLARVLHAATGLTVKRLVRPASCLDLCWATCFVFAQPCFGLHWPELIDVPRGTWVPRPLGGKRNQVRSQSRTKPLGRRCWFDFRGHSKASQVPRPLEGRIKTSQV